MRTICGLGRGRYTSSSVRALPFQRSVRCAFCLSLLDLIDDFLDSVPNNSLRSRGVVVGACHTVARSAPSVRSLVAFFLAQYAWPIVCHGVQVRFLRLRARQTLFPFAFETTGHETVVGIDGAITALGALRLVGGTLYTKAPLLEHRVAICLELFGGSDRGSKPGWLERQR